jgi:hypothetical protein
MSKDKEIPESKTFGIIIAHILIILIAYSSPIWLDWRLVTLGIGLYYLQIAIFGGCLLSLGQFKGERKSFHEWYLTKLGLRVNRRKLTFFLNKIQPFLFLIAALIMQLGFGTHPLITLP